MRGWVVHCEVFGLLTLGRARDTAPVYWSHRQVYDSCVALWIDLWQALEKARLSLHSHWEEAVIMGRSDLRGECSEKQKKLSSLSREYWGSHQR